MKYFSPEYRQKLSEAAKKRKAHGASGKIFTLEHRYKICRALSGRTRNEETKRKISETIRKKQMKTKPKPIPRKSDLMDDKWEKGYEELNIGRFLKQEPLEYNKPKDGKKPLIRFPVRGILRWV